MMCDKSKVKLKVNNGVWIAATIFYNTELIATAESVRGALRGLQESMNYVEKNLYYAVLRSEKS